ncbi:MAG: laccase domain-containing protein [Parvularculaceae bacterium]
MIAPHPTPHPTPHLTTPNLTGAGASHGFFSRAGGVSRDIFSSLNVGLGSSDDFSNVVENRLRCRETLGADHLLTLYQIHSADVVIVSEPWSGQGPKADAMATRLKGVALGVLAADCMPFLFIDPDAEIIGRTCWLARRAGGRS